MKSTEDKIHKISRSD